LGGRLVLAFDPQGDSGPESAADIIGAYRDLIRRAHARGVRIFLGTRCVRRQYLGADQCGDDLHPNDAGYHAMAQAAFQRLFAP
jgi:lysophospholipase L1-like esterase